MSASYLATLAALPDAAKFLRRLVEHEQRAFGDAEIGAVQMQLAALDRVAHERKRHQVFQAAEHRGLLDPGGEIVHRLVVALLDLLAGLDEHRHPFADEVARRQRLDLVDEGADAAALGVAEHHDVLDAAAPDGIFQRRRDAMRAAVRLIDRHQIGDVAHHEQFAGAGVEDHLRRDPGIAAADHHHFGRLPAHRQVAVARLLGRQPLRSRRSGSRRADVAGNEIMALANHRRWRNKTFGPHAVEMISPPFRIAHGKYAQGNQP